MSTVGLALRRAPALIQEGRLRWRHREDRRWAAAAAPALLARALGSASSGWRTVAVTVTSTSVAVATVVNAHGHRLVVKIAGSAESAAGLQRHAEVLARLRRDPRLNGLSAALPHVMAHGQFDGRLACVENVLPGVPASTVLERQRPAQADVLGAATRTIAELHGRTAGQRQIDDATVNAWIDSPLWRLEQFASTRQAKKRLLDSLARMRGELVGALAGRTVPTCLIHGDYWPGNLLSTPDGAEITGIVDWDRAEPDQLALHDLLHLRVLARRLTGGDELGDIVVHALRRGLEAALDVPASKVGELVGDIPPRAALLLYWLRHVATYIDSEGHHDNRRWLRSNVERVLGAV